MMHIQRLYAVVADAECKRDRTAPAYNRMARWKDSGLWESFLVHGDSPPLTFLAIICHPTENSTGSHSHFSTKLELPSRRGDVCHLPNISRICETRAQDVRRTFIATTARVWRSG